jgi:GH25 family lysozyme M1 (1,4-beta-N-acetylmuramidase)
MIFCEHNRYKNISGIEIKNNNGNVNVERLDENTIRFNTTKGTEYILGNGI